MLGKLQTRAHQFVDRAGAVFALRCVVAQGVEHGRARSAQGVGEVQQLLETGVGRHQNQVAVKHGEADIELIQPLGQQHQLVT